jgi:hypothetical protein
MTQLPGPASTEFPEYARHQRPNERYAAAGPLRDMKITGLFGGPYLTRLMKCQLAGGRVGDDVGPGG